MQPYLDIFNRVVNNHLNKPRDVIQTTQIQDLDTQLDLQLQAKGADLKTLEAVLQAFLEHSPDAAHPCLLYTSPSPRDQRGSRMPSSA